MMGRLTIRNSDGSVSQPINLDWDGALRKLAAYEDTGLTPERCAELSRELKSTKQQLGVANECIAVCAEAFSDRCHDDYAEAAIEKWEETWRRFLIRMLSSPGSRMFVSDAVENS